MVTVHGKSLHDLLGSCIQVAIAVQDENDPTISDSVITLTEFAVMGWLAETPDEPPAGQTAKTQPAGEHKLPRGQPPPSFQPEQLTGQQATEQPEHGTQPGTQPATHARPGTRR